jgi:hypothetical protein
MPELGRARAPEAPPRIPAAPESTRVPAAGMHPGPAEEFIGDDFSSSLERLGQPAAGQAETERPPRQPFGSVRSGETGKSGLKTHRRWVKPLVLLVLGIAVVGVVAWQWSTIKGLAGGVTSMFTSAPTPTPQREAAPSRKINDRVGEPGQRSSAPVAAVAQRVVLYEEDPAQPAGKQYVGSAVWRTETVSPGPGQPPDTAVRADIDIPDRKIVMRWSLRRNTDSALPASHTVEIMFTLPSDFSHGGIQSIPGLLMKQSEQTRGVPLAGLAVKVTTNFFLIGLSSVDADMQRNIQLLKERSWFDIPVVYNDGRRAILAVEKGNPGDRAFSDAFDAWTKK